MLKVLLLYTGLAFLNKPQQQQQEFIYKTFDCMGLQRQCKIMYENKRVGTLYSVVPGRSFCSGRLLIDADFVLVSQMSFHRIDPAVGKPFIRIKRPPNSIARHTMTRDTIIIK